MVRKLNLKEMAVCRYFDFYVIIKNLSVQSLVVASAPAVLVLFT